MKTLEDQMSLRGHVETITATEFRQHVGECLTQASLGKTYCIKRQGKIVAFLTLQADIIHEVLPDGRCETLA